MISRAALLALAISTPSFASEMLPDYWFENITATDGSTQQCLVFQSVAGVDYTVEISDDLETWNPQWALYGMGHEFVVPMRELAPPPSGNPPPSALPETKVVSLRLQESSGASGGTVASWLSLVDASPVTVLLPDEMDAGWATVPLFVDRFDGYLVPVWHPGTLAAPPAAAPALSSADHAFLDALEGHFDDMNLAVATSAANARNVPDPAPPAPGSRRFWRIRADWTLDSDGDGSPDWAEFWMAGQSGHGSQALANAFNADVNGDGVADELDNDQDGVFDLVDSALDDPLIDWERNLNPRFAVFRAFAPLNSNGIPQYPTHVTDRGRLAFQEGIWEDGNYVSVVDASGSGLTHCELQGINDASGLVIVGRGLFDHDVDGVADQGCHVYWTDPRQAPRLVSINGSWAQNHFPPGVPDPSNFVGRDWGFIAEFDEHTAPFSSTSYRWNLPLQQTWNTASSSPQWAHSSVDDTLIWGSDRALIDGVESSLPPGYTKLVRTPSGSVIACSPYALEPLVNRDGLWEAASNLPRFKDFSNAGFGDSFGIWSNGREWQLYQAAPDMPQNWKNQSSILDMSDSGNISMRRSPANVQDNDVYALGVPIMLEDDGFASGVDAMSIGSTEPGEAVGDKLWIMVPAGGTNKVEFRSTTSGKLNINLSASVSTVSPAMLGSPTKMIDFGTSAESATEDLPLHLSIGSESAISKPVGLKVMKRRTLKVKVWIVPKSNSGEVLRPVFTPTKQVVDDYLNGVFEPQLNVVFDSDVQEISPVGFDSENPADFGGTGADETLVNFGFGHLNIAGNHKGELIYFDHNFDPLSHINVYLVGGVYQGNHVEWINQKPVTFGPWLGTADDEGARCWVVGGWAGGLSENEFGEGRIMDIMAHEIGHVLFGPGHPDEPDAAADKGPASLPGLSGAVQRARLMCRGETRPRNGTARLVVKGEWDEAENRLGRLLEEE